MEIYIVAALTFVGAAIIYLGYNIRNLGVSDEIRIRMKARTYVRAVEKRSEWDQTIDSEHIKRARVKAALSEEFDLHNDEIDVLIEEAVFDMEADRGRGNESIKGINTGRRFGPVDGGGEYAGRESDKSDVPVGDGGRNASTGGISIGVKHEALDENFKMPSAEI